MNKRHCISALSVITVSLLLTACGKESTEREQTVKQAPEESTVALAYVNKTPITQTQLDMARSRFTVAGKEIGKDYDDKLLESLVGSRAMSLLAEKQLDEDELHRMEARVAAYREELLVKEYLRQNVEPNPVTEPMVEEYYKKHAEEFGGGVIKTFEYLQSSRELQGDERKQVLDKLADIAGQSDWQAWLKKNQELPLLHRKARSNVNVLEEPLKKLVAGTNNGEVSPVHYAKSTLLVVRVDGEQEVPAKPLAEVRAQIRKKLAPNQLRDAVKQASEQARSKVDIVYAKSE